MSVKLFKFGGASVRDAENLRNVRNILQRYRDNKLVLVISAMGKTTNALELVCTDYMSGGKAPAMARLEAIIADHLDTAVQLGLDKNAVRQLLDALASEAFGKLDQAALISASAVYDQIVSLGELFSTHIVHLYFQAEGFRSAWLDVRKIIYTDSNFREAIVDFQRTQEAVNTYVKPLIVNNDLVITQGFIGRADNDLTVTLGREGSDYTAAILAFCLDIQDLAIWKDVPGVLTADPRKFENVEKIDKMSYTEAIEMSYYGAQVIHPKTIRPLQNKGIRLHVKSFLEPDKEGTVISADGLLNYPAIVVIQEDVILLQISSPDFSFIAENHLSQIFALLNRHRIKLCTMRNSAISFTICIKNPGKEEFEALINELEKGFMLDVFKGLQLYTLRYSSDALIKKLTKNKVVLFEEKMKYTIQMALRPALELKEKE